MKQSKIVLPDLPADSIGAMAHLLLSSVNFLFPLVIKKSPVFSFLHSLLVRTHLLELLFLHVGAIQTHIIAVLPTVE